MNGCKLLNGKRRDWERGLAVSARGSSIYAHTTPGSIARPVPTPTPPLSPYYAVEHVQRSEYLNMCDAVYLLYSRLPASLWVQLQYPEIQAAGFHCA
eukprot:6180080-Pleurochrysis_carterae.AAC.3